MSETITTNSPGGSTTTSLAKTTMPFEDALVSLKQGYQARRKGWNGKGLWVKMQVPDEHSKMSLPYVYIKSIDDRLVPWVPSQTDLLCEDWEVLDSAGNAYELINHGVPCPGCKFHMLHNTNTTEYIKKYGLGSQKFTNFCPDCGNQLREVTLYERINNIPSDGET
jgi:hypothetical protein